MCGLQTEGFPFAGHWLRPMPRLSLFGGRREAEVRAIAAGDATAVEFLGHMAAEYAQIGVDPFMQPTIIRPLINPCAGIPRIVCAGLERPGY